MSNRIVLTVLPREGWQSSRKVSICISFQAGAGGAAQAVGDLPAVRDWPQLVRGLDFTAHVLEDSQTRPIGRFRPSFAVSAAEAMRTWRTLMPDDVPLGSARRFAPAAAPDIRGYDFHGLTDAVESVYNPLRPTHRRLVLQDGALSGIDWWGFEEMKAADGSGISQSQASKFRDFALYHQPGENLPAAAAAETRDFAERLAEIAHYPALRRYLGLVVDAELVVDAGGAVPGQGGLAVGLPPDQAAAIGIDIVSFWSMYETDRSGPSSWTAMASRQGDQVRKRDFYLLSPRSIRLVQYELDTAVFGIMRAARAEREANRQRLAPGVRAEGPPSLRSVGFSLYHGAILADLQGAAARMAELERQAGAVVSGSIDANAPKLYANDVDAGYRIDVHWDRTNRWHPLCGRSHQLVVGERRIALDHLGPAEGYVSLALSSAANGGERTSQRLFGWLGWSLVLARIENPVDPAGEAQSAPSTDAAWHVVERPPPGGLPGLRFGDRYRFRCRSVDLAGNSVPFDKADAAAAGLVDVATRAERFLRLEPVPPPLLFTHDPPKPGEKPLLMVVHGGSGAERSRRAIHPPTGAFELLERHGALAGEAAAYELLTLATQRPVASGGELKVAEFRPYVADPIAGGARFLLEGEGRELDAGAAWFPPGARRTMEGGLTLELRRGAFAARLRGRVLRVSLPKGQSARLRIASTVRPESRPMLAFDDPALAAPPPHVAPFVDLILVHATPVPLARPTYGHPAFAERSRNHTHVTFGDPSLAVDAATTGRVTFRATWVERFDDPATPDWSRRERAAIIAAQDVELPSDGPLGFTAARAFPQTASLASRAAAAMPVNRTGIFGAGDGPSNRFDFQDTASRELRISPRGHTRHAEFFPPPRQADGTAPPPEPPTLDGAAAVLQVMSSANPSPPVPLYILPTFRRLRARGRGRRVSRTEGWSLRVFLARDWRFDERLAIIFGQGADRDKHSAIAQDPLIRATRALTPLTSRDIAGDHVDGLWLPVDDRYFASGDTGAAERVDIAFLEVKYDARKNLRYADVVLTPRPGAYQPFVRLALGRYNPKSIAGAELSKMIVADWAQPAANRSVSLVRSEGGWLLTVRADAADETSPASRNHFRAHAEYTEMLGEDEYAWEPVDNSEVELRQAGQGLEQSWQAIMQLPPARLFGRRRVVVREMLAHAGGTCDLRPQGSRLVAFEIIDL